LLIQDWFILLITRARLVVRLESVSEKNWIFFFYFELICFLCFQIILMCWSQKWFLKNKKILLAYFSEWKALWKATTTTLPNTLLNQVVNQVKSYNCGVFICRLDDYLSIIIATWMPVLTWKKSWHKHGIN
jgi:hypothetical protein